LKSKYILVLFFLFLSFITQNRAWGQPFQNRRAFPVPPQTHSLLIHYRDAIKSPSLIQKMGSSVAIAPFKDTDRNRHYIGQHVTHGRVSGFFRSEPFPLEKSIQDFSVAFLRNSGVDPLFVSAWNGKPEGLRSLKGESILKVIINRFWIKAETTTGRTRVFAWIYLDFFLGMKRLDQVLTQSVYVGEETIYGPEFTPQALRDPTNQTLRNVMESFLGSL
jgi:hypothetical protein